MRRGLFRAQPGLPAAHEPRISSCVQNLDVGGGMREGTANWQSARVEMTDRVFGVLVLALGFAAIVLTRSITIIFPILAVAAGIALIVSRTPLNPILSAPKSFVALAALLGFAAVSAAWSASPSVTIAHSALFLFILFQGHLLSYWVATQPASRIRHLAFWLTIAFLLGLAVLTFEVLSSQALRLALIEHFSIFKPTMTGRQYKFAPDGTLRIANFELNRSVAAANMLLWPIVLCAASYWSGRKRALICATLVGGVMLATMESVHETSKLAVLCGMVIFCAAYFLPRVTAIATATVWSALIVGIVPFALLAHDHLHLQDAAWLQNSARARIVIWKKVADSVMESPMLGVGARTGYVLNEQQDAAGDEPPTVPRHAHNVFLQTWYELGAIGAAILLVAGLLCIQAIWTLPPSVYPFALATFAVGAGELATSWEIWQRWFFTLYVLVWFCLALAIRSSKEKQAAPAF